MARPKRTNSTPKRAVTRGRDWTKTFIKALGNSGNVTIACKAAVIDRVTAYTKRKADPEFRDRWRVALNEAAELLEAEARRRAEHGVDEPVIHQGQLMGSWVNAKGEVVTKDAPGAKLIPLTIKKYSDTLLIFLMKGAKPQKYRDNAKIEHTGAGKGGAIVHEVRQPLDLEKLERDLEQFALRSAGGRVSANGNGQSVHSDNSN